MESTSEEIKSLPRVSHRIEFEQDVIDFMKEYKSAFIGSIQSFVRDAVDKRIADIKINEELKELENLK